MPLRASRRAPQGVRSSWKSSRKEGRRGRQEAAARSDAADEIGVDRCHQRKMSVTKRKMPPAKMLPTADPDTAGTGSGRRRMPCAGLLQASYARHRCDRSRTAKFASSWFSMTSNQSGRPPNGPGPPPPLPGGYRCTADPALAARICLPMLPVLLLPRRSL